MENKNGQALTLEERLSEIEEQREKEYEVLSNVSDEEYVDYLAATYKETKKFAKNNDFNVIEGGD